MIDRPRSDEFVELGLAADLRDLGAVVAPWCKAVLSMAAILCLCAGGGIPMIFAYCEWLGATVFPQSHPGMWVLLAFGACLAAYIRLSFPKRLPSTGSRSLDGSGER